MTYFTFSQVNTSGNRSISPVSISCITTDSNNDITLNWEQADDPDGDFDNYEIERIGDGVIATINDITTTSFLIAGDGASVNQYIVSATYSCVGCDPVNSDTLSNILLEINNPDNGIAILNWNNPIEPEQNHFNDFYLIYREYPTGTWALIDSIPFPQATYRDTITICEEFINYQIVLPTTECDFTSNIDGDDFKDMIVPDIPVILSASIDTLTNNVVVSWDENSQSDTYGYVIYTMNENNFLIEIDTVWGKQNTSYIHEDVDVDNGSLTYSVAAFDSCLTATNPPTYQTSAKAEIHETVFLEGNISICEREASMNWTDYVGFDSLQHYEVWGRNNNEPWQVYDTINTLNWTTSIQFGDDFVFRVRAVSASSNDDSFSNEINISFAEAGGPAYSFLSVASVEGDVVEILHRTSEGGGVKAIELEKYDHEEEEFVKIDEMSVGNQSEILFIDEDVKVNDYSYTYRTRIIDTCDQILGVSNIGKTILMNVITDNSSMTHTLQWTGYTKFVGKLTGYKVYRGMDGFFDEEPIAVLKPDIRSFTDSLFNMTESNEGRVCYMVVAVEDDNVSGQPENSKSNVRCPAIQPLIYIPNAFSVGGANPIFKPVTDMHLIEDYNFSVFDRFGRIIFETNDPTEGWDGFINASNSYAREGMYIYRLSLRDGNGVEVLRHGHVTLLNAQE